MTEEMKKYMKLLKIKRYFHMYDEDIDAINQELVSPTAVYIKESDKILTLDCGFNKLCEIKLIEGEIIIRPKITFTLDSELFGILDINKIA